MGWIPLVMGLLAVATLVLLVMWAAKSVLSMMIELNAADATWDREDFKTLSERSDRLLSFMSDQVEKGQRVERLANQLQAVVDQLNANTQAVSALETVVHTLYQSSGPVRRRAVETQVGEEPPGAEKGRRIVVVPGAMADEEQEPEPDGFVDAEGRPMSAVPRSERDLAATPPT